MGFYIRKSVRVGPFRFNLSKSGVGVSVGVPGFRVGMSPRGNYVHMGARGIYYRTTLPSGDRSISSTGSTNKFNQTAPSSIPEVAMMEIESATTSTIVDAESAAFVDEINAKRRKVRLWPFALAVGVLSLMFTSSEPGAPSWSSAFIVCLTLLATIGTAFFDQIRKSTVLMFDLEGDSKARFEQLCSAFERLGNSQARWHVSASGAVSDRKYHAGASTLIKRSAISIRSSGPSFVKTNIPVPSVPVGRQTLYFFPDKVLVFEPNAVGAVSYGQLNVAVHSSRFVEDGQVPRDAQIVGSTWKYVNKKGGPDKRFKNNRQLPIAMYEEIAFGSATGLNECIQVSKVGIGQDIQEAIAGQSRVAG